MRSLRPGDRGSILPGGRVAEGAERVQEQPIATGVVLGALTVWRAEERGDAGALHKIVEFRGGQQTGQGKVQPCWGNGGEANPGQGLTGKGKAAERLTKGLLGPTSRAKRVPGESSVVALR